MKFEKLNKVDFLKLLFILISITISGYLRLFLFENINLHLANIYYEKDVSSLIEELSFIKNYSYNTLMWIKWGLTILFTIIYLILTLSVIRILFRNKMAVNITIIIFSFIVIISFLFYAVFGFFNELALGYRLARFCMGIVQSPLPLMILIPAFKLLNNK